MPSLRRASLSPSPRRQRTATAPSLAPEEGGGSYAEYAERRDALLQSIRGGLDDHVRDMEGRAREAVAHAAAVAQTSRAQAAECLDYVGRLENQIAALQQSRRTCEAELHAAQTSAAETRRALEEELTSLRQSVEEARQQARLAHEEQERCRLLREAEERRHAVAETHLRDFTATVELRFRRAVDTLESEVRERKQWADQQCALYERCVREAAWRAEQSERSHGALHYTEAMARARAAAVPTARESAAKGVPSLRGWEGDDAASAAARRRCTGSQTGAAQLQKCARCSPSATASSASTATSPPPPPLAAQPECRRLWESESDDCRPATAAPPVSNTRASSAAEATVRHTLCSAAASDDTATPLPCRLVAVDGVPRLADDTVHFPDATAAPAAAAAAAAAAAPPSPTPRADDSLLRSTGTPLCRVPVRRSASPPFPDRRLILDVSCSTDAFATISTPRRREA
ncbi:hypothetical protein NESM_000706500 [Novymonas esmeraldas]|uniref:Uncharacterized protein n=1 Tax=Novymonas esmeraldas TaxID=1808958 RepID=A0AAW0ETS0_9TRYP